MIDRDVILLKRLKDSDLKKRMYKLVDYCSGKFPEAGATKSYIEKEIAEARRH